MAQKRVARVAMTADEARGLTQHLIDEKFIKEPTPEMLEEALEKAIKQVE